MREWKQIREFKEILFEAYNGIAKITINRPRYRNAFTPKTTYELSQAFALCREMQDISVVLLTGAMSEVPEGKTLADVKHAFCSGGDMHVKGRGGYVDEEGVPRLSVLDVQMQIRRLPKPVIAMVNGYAIGGGHVLHLVCDLTIASENAIFGQTGPKVGSFDAGFGSSYLARIVGQKKAREIWFLCRQYTAKEAEEMGMVNKVVPIERLERNSLATAPCSIISSMKRRRVARPFLRSASLTSRNIPNCHDLSDRGAHAAFQATCRDVARSLYHAKDLAGLSVGWGKDWRGGVCAPA